MSWSSRRPSGRDCSRRTPPSRAAWSARHGSPRRSPASGSAWTRPSDRARQSSLALVDARLFDRTLELSARRRLAIGPAFGLVGSAGAAAEWTSLQGTAGPARAAVDVERLDASVDAALRATWRLGRAVAIGAAGDVAWVLRPQRYEAGGVAVARLATWQPGGMLWIDVAPF